ncbi:DUF1294 domain-containing protein [Desulfoscipio geothermicus]|uniref:Uncharacterized membrane protein YsdA, DUF1294 family n=1 Tax=Desulfoscipio geothermicus DSM 3669 TaxID=1121426 RepID=A0A1I6CQZ5_9FIRM|nr:DUF1294 domain-containing protein [Desulfoscipio geothermicus]SFQ95601.1 Uncharacterized membrane protein YsdA, DUF1294 family [Desulfoscipio geothermicus DSM 3669]
MFLAYLVLINGISFFLFGLDKRRARRKHYRVAERTLFLAAWAGGSAGALAGMYLFRHKTRRPKFTLGIPLVLLLQTTPAALLLRL